MLYVHQQALWAERPVDGQPRMLARYRRMYRPQVLPGLVPSQQLLPVVCCKRMPSAVCAPDSHAATASARRDGLQETVFMSTGSPAEVFLSDHIEARVPVADISAKCAPTCCCLAC
jgi:hypothetical protein